MVHYGGLEIFENQGQDSIFSNLGDGSSLVPFVPRSYKNHAINVVEITAQHAPHRSSL